MNKPPKVETLLKIHEWVQRNKSMIATRTRNQVLRDLQADTGIKCGAVTLRQMEESVGIKRTRGGHKTGAKKDRVKVVAEVLREVMTELNIRIPSELADIISGH